MLRTTKQKVLFKIDIASLRQHFDLYEIANAFGVSMDYVRKIENQQKIIIGVAKVEDELRFGRRGAWMNSPERKVIKKIK